MRVCTYVQCTSELTLSFPPSTSYLILFSIGMDRGIIGGIIITPLLLDGIAGEGGGEEETGEGRGRIKVGGEGGKESGGRYHTMQCHNLLNSVLSSL